MTNTNNNNQKKPAKDYRKRARTIIEQMLNDIKIIFGREEHKKPITEETMEKLIDEFHHILNWASDGTKKLRFPAKYYLGPLTEKEMQAVENNFAEIEKTFIKYDGIGTLAIADKSESKKKLIKILSNQ